MGGGVVIGKITRRITECPSMSMNAENARKDLRSCSGSMRITGKCIARNAEAIDQRESYPLFPRVQTDFRGPAHPDPVDPFVRGPGVSGEIEKKGDSFMG